MKHRRISRPPGRWAVPVLAAGLLALGRVLPSAARAAGAASLPDAPPAAAPAVDEGVINGARFAVALPAARWNRKVLLVAHDWRPTDAPLVADLRPDRLSLRTLLGEGWMVAATSYRHNGFVVEDAIADLDALRARIADRYGDPDRVVVEGEGMGGLIAVLMAERDSDAYAGALALGATLAARETNSGVGLSLQPRIPLLFVCGSLDLRSARSYVETTMPRPDPCVPPALLTVSRDGFGAIDEQERLTALRALDAWIENGRQALPRPPDDTSYADITQAADPGPSTAEFAAGLPGFAARIGAADFGDGHLELLAQARDFAAADIPPRTYFHLDWPGHSLRVLYGCAVADVRPGHWVALPDPEGDTRLIMRLEYGARSAGLKAGDRVRIIPY